MPKNLRDFLVGHQVDTAVARGWQEFRNGDLLTTAEQDGYDLFITADQSLAYQQNLSGRRIGILELTKNNWPSIEPHTALISDAVNQTMPGTYRVIECAYVFKGHRFHDQNPTR